MTAEKDQPENQNQQSDDKKTAADEAQREQDRQLEEGTENPA